MAPPKACSVPDQIELGPNLGILMLKSRDPVSFMTARADVTQCHKSNLNARWVACHQRQGPL